jgi:hypothetical protein
MKRIGGDDFFFFFDFAACLIAQALFCAYIAVCECA